MMHNASCLALKVDGIIEKQNIGHKGWEILWANVEHYAHVSNP